jgi:hypothetical protein
VSHTNKSPLSFEAYVLGRRAMRAVFLAPAINHRVTVLREAASSWLTAAHGATEPGSGPVCLACGSIELTRDKPPHALALLVPTTRQGDAFAGGFCEACTRQARGRVGLYDAALAGWRATWPEHEIELSYGGRS